MQIFLALVVVIISLITFSIYWHRRQVSRREVLIDTFEFPPGLGKRIHERYPHLQQNQIDRVIEGLREYFHVCNRAGRRMVGMPSQVVDVAWHEFIIYTRVYEHFCKRALGRFLHHTPTEVMVSPTLAQESIKRAWRHSCAREGIDKMAPTRLPILFALDRDLDIPDGFRYAVDCSKPGPDKYCGGHVGCGSGCATGCSSDSSGSDSGDGCGGGCGGD